MRITRVTLNFTETCNLGDYSNTKPSLELMADLELGDDVQAVIGQLSAIAKETLRAKIDEELEVVGKSPKYYNGPLYSVYMSGRYNYILIVPAESIRHISHETYYSMRQRHEIARAKAEELAGNGDRPIFDGFSPEFHAYFEAAEAKFKKEEDERRFQAAKQQREWEERIRREREEAEAEEEEEDFDEEESDDDE